MEKKTLIILGKNSVHRVKKEETIVVKGDFNMEAQSL